MCDMATLAVQVAMAAKPVLALRHHLLLRAKSRMFASIIPTEVLYLLLPPNATLRWHGSPPLEEKLTTAWLSA